MNDNLGGCVSELNIKYSKVVLQICPQGVDADCSFAVTVDNHNVVGGQSDQTADVARLHGTNPSPSDCGNFGDIQVATGFALQFTVPPNAGAARASTASSGLAYSCISSSNPEPSPPDLPSVLFSRETSPC